VRHNIRPYRAVLVLLLLWVAVSLLSCEFSVSHKFHGKTPPGNDSPETNSPSTNAP
jgi:hypothetical protein